MDQGIKTVAFKPAPWKGSGQKKSQNWCYSKLETSLYYPVYNLHSASWLLVCPASSRSLWMGIALDMLQLQQHAVTCPLHTGCASQCCCSVTATDNTKLLQCNRASCMEPKWNPDILLIRLTQHISISWVLTLSGPPCKSVINMNTLLLIGKK